MRQLRMILGFLTLAMGMAALGCDNPEAPVEKLLAVGDSYGGGIVAYLNETGSPQGNILASTATVKHGLIAATADQSTRIIWATDGSQWTAVPTLGATGRAVGTGLANTNAIFSQNGTGTAYAAGLARAYAGGGYSDWFLPSQDELNELYLNKAAIGGFGSAWYWSSSEGNDHGYAWGQGFNGGRRGNGLKGYYDAVRAVRAF